MSPGDLRKKEWSSLVRGALLWLGCVDPVESVEAIRQGDPKLADLETLAAQWWQTIGRDRVTVADVIKRATAPTYDSGFEHPDFREALLSVAGARGALNSRRLGSWLSDNAGRIVGGLHFERVGERQGVAVWCLAGDSDPTASLSSEDDFMRF
jgi:putative DNA primase/helicase